MKVTDEFLMKHKACSHGMLWFKRYCNNGGNTEVNEVIDALIADGRHFDAVWLTARAFEKNKLIKIAYLVSKKVNVFYPNEDPHKACLNRMLDLMQAYINEPKDVSIIDIEDAIYTVFSTATKAFNKSFNVESYVAETIGYSGQLLLVSRNILSYDFSTSIEKASHVIFHIVRDSLSKGISVYEVDKLAVAAQLEAVDLFLSYRFRVQNEDENKID